MISHRLRDSFVVDVLQKGIPLEDVSKLLGDTRYCAHDSVIRRSCRG